MAPTTDVRAGLMSGGVLDWQVQDGDWDDCVSLDKAQLDGEDMQAGEWLVIYYKDNQNRNRRAFGYLCAIRQRIPTRTTARKGEHLDYESNWYRDNTLLCVSWAHKISDIRRPSDEDKKIIQRAGLGDDDMVLSDWFDVVPLSTVTTFAEGECLSATVLVRRLGRPKGPKDLALSSGVILFRKTNVDATGVLAQSRPAHLRTGTVRLEGAADSTDVSPDLDENADELPQSIEDASGDVHDHNDSTDTDSTSSSEDSSDNSTSDHDEHSDDSHENGTGGIDGLPLTPTPGGKRKRPTSSILRPRKAMRSLGPFDPMADGEDSSPESPLGSQSTSTRIRPADNSTTTNGLVNPTTSQIATRPASSPGRIFLRFTRQRQQPTTAQPSSEAHEYVGVNDRIGEAARQLLEIAEQDSTDEGGDEASHYPATLFYADDDPFFPNEQTSEEINRNTEAVSHGLPNVWSSPSTSSPEPFASFSSGPNSSAAHDSDPVRRSSSQAQRAVSVSSNASSASSLSMSSDSDRSINSPLFMSDSSSLPNSSSASSSVSSFQGFSSSVSSSNSSSASSSISSSSSSDSMPHPSLFQSAGYIQGSPFLMSSDSFPSSESSSSSSLAPSKMSRSSSSSSSSPSPSQNSPDLSTSSDPESVDTVNTASSTSSQSDSGDQMSDLFMHEFLHGGTHIPSTPNDEDAGMSNDVHSAATSASIPASTPASQQQYAQQETFDEPSIRETRTEATVCQNLGRSMFDAMEWIMGHRG